MADWGMFPLPSTVKQKACKSTLQVTLIGQAKQELVRLSEPIQYRTETGVLAGTSSL